MSLADVGVEAFDEPAVAFDFAAPAAGLGVAGERLSVGALRDEHGQVAGVGAEVRAVPTDVGVGARALGLGADAEPTGQRDLQPRSFLPVLGQQRQPPPATWRFDGQPIDRSSCVS